MVVQAEQMVSIIGAGYFQPVADLVGKLLRYPPTRRNAVKANYYDNIYSVSIILLLVAVVESYASRLRFFYPSSHSQRRFSVPESIKGTFKDFHLAKALSEVFVLRDAIFHNHLWTINFSWRPMSLQSAAIDSSSGDEKFKKIVNLKTRRTRSLRLHIVPTRVDRRDVLKVFDTVLKTLLFLERKDRNYCYVSDQNVSFRGKTHRFSEVRDTLANAQ